MTHPTTPRLDAAAARAALPRTMSAEEAALRRQLAALTAERDAAQQRASDASDLRDQWERQAFEMQAERDALNADADRVRTGMEQLHHECGLDLPDEGLSIAELISSLLVSAHEIDTRNLAKLAAERNALRAAVPLVSALRQALSTSGCSGALVGVQGSTVTVDVVTATDRVDAVREAMADMFDALIHP